jgi:hypothetical protein
VSKRRPGRNSMASETRQSEIDKVVASHLVTHFVDPPFPSYSVLQRELIMQHTVAMDLVDSCLAHPALAA